MQMKPAPIIGFSAEMPESLLVCRGQADRCSWLCGDAGTVILTASMFGWSSCRLVISPRPLSSTGIAMSVLGPPDDIRLWSNSNYPTTNHPPAELWRMRTVVTSCLLFSTRHFLAYCQPLFPSLYHLPLPPFLSLSRPLSQSRRHRRARVCVCVCVCVFGFIYPLSSNAVNHLTAVAYLRSSSIPASPPVCPMVWRSRIICVHNSRRPSDPCCTWWR